MGKSGKTKRAGEALGAAAQAWAAAKVQAGLASRHGESPAAVAEAAEKARLAALAKARAGNRVDARAARAAAQQARAAEQRARGLADGHDAGEAREAGAIVGFSVGHRRVAGRDGLVWLNDTGALTGKPGKGAHRTQTDWMRGSVRFYGLLAYRACFEDAQARLGSALADKKVATAGCAGSSGTSDPYVWAALMTGDKARRLGEAERAVLTRWPGGLELKALREVAGRGLTVGAVVRGGKQAAALTAALLRAADLTAPILAVQGSELLPLDARSQAVLDAVFEARRKARPLARPGN